MKLRQLAGITRREVATLCAVSEATVRRWEDASKPPPRAIVLLLHLSGGQLGVLDPAWQDWCIRAGQLWAPHLLGRGFQPEHLKVYEYAFMERDALRQELDKARAAASLKSGHQGGNGRLRCHAVRAEPGTPGQVIAPESVDAGLPLPRLPMRGGQPRNPLKHDDMVPPSHAGAACPQSVDAQRNGQPDAGSVCMPEHGRGTLVDVETSPGSLRSPASADPPPGAAKPAGRHPALATPRDRASGRDGTNPAPGLTPAVNGPARSPPASSPGPLNGGYTLCAIERAEPDPAPRPVRWWLDRLDRWQAHEADFMTLRQMAGITRQEVAQLCAVTEATVKRWEDASKPPPRAIVLLVQARPAHPAASGMIPWCTQTPPVANPTKPTGLPWRPGPGLAMNK